MPISLSALPAPKDAQTYCNWDHRILAVLPPVQAAEFPAELGWNFKSSSFLDALMLPEWRGKG